MKNAMLFSNEKILRVPRFYHLDFYYFITLLAGKGLITFDGLFNAIIQQQNELIDLSSVAGSKEKFKTEYQIKSVIEEMVRFDLLKIIDKKYFDITSEGEILLSHIYTRRLDDAEKIICQKMESNYSQPSQLLKYLKKLNRLGNGLIVFPRPSPSALDISTDEIINGKRFEDYSRACADYAHREILKFMGISISADALFHRLSTLLLVYFEKMGYRKQSINIPREVKQIMYDFYIDNLLDGKFDVRTLDIWIKRCKELKIVNSTEQFPGFNGLVLYPIAVLSNDELQSDEFTFMAIAEDDNKIYRYDPKWQIHKEMFVKSLWDNYIELSRSHNTFFIPVQDLRDIVCYKLQISESKFAEFLGFAYNESMNEIIRHFKISLEVDRSPQERKFKNSKRLPILINKVPKNIIGIKMN